MTFVANVFVTGMIIGIIWAHLDKVAKGLGLVFGAFLGGGILIGLGYKKGLHSLFGYTLTNEYADIVGIGTMLIGLSFIGRSLWVYW